MKNSVLYVLRMVMQSPSIRDPSQPLVELLRPIVCATLNGERVLRLHTLDVSRRRVFVCQLE